MTADLATATEQMQKLFKAAWDANSGAIFGYVPDVEWYGVESQGKVDKSKVWVRFSTQNMMEGQATLSTCVDVPYQKRYNGSGLIFIQLFLPKSVDNAVIEGRRLAAVARNAYRGKKTEGGVTFFNVRIVDVATEELYYRFNVVAEYDYDELG